MLQKKEEEEEMTTSLIQSCRTHETLQKTRQVILRHLMHWVPDEKIEVIGALPGSIRLGEMWGKWKDVLSRHWPKRYVSHLKH